MLQVKRVLQLVKLTMDSIFKKGRKSIAKHRRSFYVAQATSFAVDFRWLRRYLKSRKQNSKNAKVIYKEENFAENVQRAPLIELTFRRRLNLLLMKSMSRLVSVQNRTKPSTQSQDDNETFFLLRPPFVDFCKLSRRVSRPFCKKTQTKLKTYKKGKWKVAENIFPFYYCFVRFSLLVCRRLLWVIFAFNFHFHRLRSLSLAAFAHYKAIPARAFVADEKEARGGVGLFWSLMRATRWMRKGEIESNSLKRQMCR